MKYDNFVGGGWLPMDKEELEQMMAHFKKQLVGFFGEEFFSGFSYKYEPNPISGVINAIFTAKLTKPFNGRNGFKSTIKNCSEIRFFVTKNKGKYLEIQDKKHPYEPKYYKHDVKHCPSFSYGCDMYVNGSERPYRCRHWQSIQNWSPYTYGTEIKDLTYDVKDLFGLKRTITSR